MIQRKLVWLMVLSMLLGGLGCRRAAQQSKPVAYVPSQATVDQGEQLVQTPDLVWKNYKCDTKKLPMMVIENNYLKPATVEVGHRQINHFITYAMCPERGAGTMAGTLQSEIYFNGRQVVTTRKPFEIKPGRWLLNGVIELPANPPVGTYQLRTEIVDKGGKRYKAMNASFEVYR